jgi:hypothetical protein
MPPIGNKVGKTHAQKVDKEHHSQHGKKEAEKPAGEEPFYGVFGHHGKGKIHCGDKKSAEHIRSKELPVGLVISGENLQQGFVKIVFYGHNGTITSIAVYP